MTHIAELNQDEVKQASGGQGYGTPASVGSVGEIPMNLNLSNHDLKNNTSPSASYTGPK